MKLWSDKWPETEIDSFAKVEEFLAWADREQTQTFFILEDIDESFVQVACDTGKYIIEKKYKAKRELYRAYCKARFGTINTQQVRVTQFKLIAQGDELLTLPEVTDIFRAFYQGENMPADIGWRYLTNTEE
jgi:hypothetical protein